MNLTVLTTGRFPSRGFLFSAIALLALVVDPAVSLARQVTAEEKKTQDDLPEASKVIDDYLEATGGETAHQKIDSIVAKGTIGIPEAGIEGEVVMTQTDEKGLMVINLAGIGENRVGYDGETAWQIAEMTGPEIIEGEQKDQMIAQMKISPFMVMDQLYDTVKTTGKEEFNGEQCYVVEASKAGQNPVLQYFSVESRLLTGMRLTAINQMGEMEIVSKISDYRDVSGVKMPFETIAELPQGMTMKTSLKSIEANTDIDDSVFDLPEEIKKLRE